MFGKRNFLLLYPSESDHQHAESFPYATVELISTFNFKLHLIVSFVSVENFTFTTV